MKQELKELQYRLSEISRYLEGIETSAFPGLDCAVVETQLAQELVDKLLQDPSLLDSQKTNKLEGKSCQ